MRYIELGQVITNAKTERCKDKNLPVLSITKKDGLVLQSDKFKKRIASDETEQYKIVKRGYLVQGIHIDEANFGIQDVVDQGIVSPAYKVWDVDTRKISPRFLEYTLRSPRSIRYYASKFNGSIRRRERITDKDFLSMSIPLPSMDDQQRCVAVLDKVNRIICLQQQVLQTTNDLIKARFVEMFGDVIHNDKSWDIYTFSDITESRLCKMLDSKKQTGQSPFPYLANANVQWFRFDINNLNTMDFSENDREEFALEDGDLMVCEGGEIGRCAVWHNQIQPCYFQKAIHRVRCNRDVILPDYLSWWFKYNCDHQGFADIEGAKATISHLPGAKMKKLQVVVPDIEIQKQFCEFVEQVDKSKSAVKKFLDEAQMLLDSLMQKYFG